MNEITTEPLKATWKTSYFVIFAATVLIAPLFIIGLLWLANSVLPAEDATAFKEPLWTIWKWMAGASGLATLAGGLLRTHGKITAQVEQMKAEVKQAAQPLKGAAIGYSDRLGDLPITGNSFEGVGHVLNDVEVKAASE